MALSDRKFVVFKSSLLPGDSSFPRYSHFLNLVGIIACRRGVVRCLVVISGTCGIIY